jgi:hypothetical protein
MFVVVFEKFGLSRREKRSTVPRVVRRVKAALVLLVLLVLPVLALRLQMERPMQLHPELELDQLVLQPELERVVLQPERVQLPPPVVMYASQIYEIISRIFD